MKPVTNKPIPKTLKAWRAEYDGIRKMLHKVDRMKKDNGDKWVANMLEYYRTRLKDLEANKPKGNAYKAQKKRPASK